MAFAHRQAARGSRSKAGASAARATKNGGGVTRIKRRGRAKFQSVKTNILALGTVADIITRRREMVRLRCLAREIHQKIAPSSDASRRIGLKVCAQVTTTRSCSTSHLESAWKKPWKRSTRKNQTRLQGVWN